jgi:demethylspheroidene O-methyltransferase
MQVRNRLLASPRFQRWAARFPLTRRIARREAQALFDLCAGFVYSQVLLACVELRLFAALRDGRLGLDDLARQLELPGDSARRLLEAAASLRLVERCGRNEYRLGRLGAVLEGSPAIKAMIAHHRLVYADLGDPVALLRGATATTRLSGFWPYAGGMTTKPLEDADVAAYTALMSASQPLVADDILDAYPMRGHHCLLDVAGGEGLFLESAALRAPRLGLMLFDLPPVAARARERLALVGLATRARVVGGDFRSEPLPRGADLISLVRVVHDHDDATVVNLLHAVRAALPPDGKALIAEPMSGPPEARAMADAYFGFYLLAMGRGRPRSPREVAGLAQAAGFRRVESVPTARPLLTSLVVAHV